MNNIIEQLNQEELTRLNKTIPSFFSGDVVSVRTHVVDGSTRRIQAFEGMVIARRNRGINESFIVRRTSSGEAMERTFQTYSPLIESIQIVRHGDVRRSKLYYLRERSGKSARIREKLGAKKAQKPR
ncbi:50S ribosomal protein L19 [Candidatus Persebacteraceae bacterium Df01]|jgi:large subunit ribosomal protein L19|uniref:Large ribosomal subunit protein bL19 n=1 Tax=Candidatus Doriopsillibacter californiensis TaxID=2970740 RepID=A0ABT7QKE6_9GAMM|nr:50S ribosomal protein L19 [Candidatus Persebacteraceae bacterium Df01]